MWPPQLVATLLRSGRPVRATVRTAPREAELRAAVRRGDADDAGLEIVVAELTSDEGWATAMAGCEEVHHVASPIPYVQPDDPDELIVPAREGTLRVLRAARDAGARRVVLTSSFAAVGYTPKPGAEYTEADWTDPDTPGLAPYPRSKAIAERAAWDFIEREGGATELVVVNPTFILGPSLSTHLVSSLRLIEAMLDGKMPVVPRQRFGLVDVRDVADLHIRAMETPEARGKRFLGLADGPTISFLTIAQLLRERLGRLAERVPTEEAPGEELPNLIIHNDRARTGAGMAPTTGRDHHRGIGRMPTRPRPPGAVGAAGSGLRPTDQIAETAMGPGQSWRAARFASGRRGQNEAVGPSWLRETHPAGRPLPGYRPSRQVTRHCPG